MCVTARRVLLIVKHTEAFHVTVTSLVLSDKGPLQQQPLCTSLSLHVVFCSDKSEKRKYVGVVVAGGENS